MTSPKLFQILTPILASLESENITPSKLVFKSSATRGFHFLFLWVGQWPQARLLLWSSARRECWGIIFSFMPHAPILFNHIYLFTKKYQNITYKLFWASMNISHPIGPQIFHILLSKLGHDINHHKNLKNSYLIKFYYHYLAKSKTTPTSPMHTSRAVHQKPKIDPPTQTAQADLKIGRPDTGDIRRWVFATKNRFRRVGWRVLFSKTRWTRSNRRNPWKKTGST